MPKHHQGERRLGWGKKRNARASFLREEKKGIIDIIYVCGLPERGSAELKEGKRRGVNSTGG